MFVLCVSVETRVEYYLSISGIFLEEYMAVLSLLLSQVTCTQKIMRVEPFFLNFCCGLVHAARLGSHMHVRLLRIQATNFTSYVSF